MTKRIERLDEYEDLEGFIDLSFRSHCGLLMRKGVAAKYLTIQKNAIRDVKKLLMDNLDEIEVSEWTLDYENGKQESVHYYTEENQSKEAKIDRVNVINRVGAFDVRKHEAIYKFKNRDEVKSLMIKANRGG